MPEILRPAFERYQHPQRSPFRKRRIAGHDRGDFHPLLHSCEGSIHHCSSSDDDITGVLTGYFSYTLSV